MDWDLAVIPESVSKSITFHQLLDNLRSVHEEVCARNALLERRASNHNGPMVHDASQGHSNGPSHDISQGASSDGHGSLLEGRGSVMGHLSSLNPTMGHFPSLNATQSKNAANFTAEDPWLPCNFLAPKEGPPPRRPVRVTSTPRSYVVQATDILTRQQEEVHQSIDSLARQQDYLTTQVNKIITMGASTPRRGRKTHMGGLARKSQMPRHTEHGMPRHTEHGGHAGHNGIGAGLMSSRISRLRHSMEVKEKEEKEAATASVSQEHVALPPTKEKKHIRLQEVAEDGEPVVNFTSAPSEPHHESKKERQQSAIVRATMRFAVQTKTTGEFGEDDEGSIGRTWSEDKPALGFIARWRKKLRNTLSSTAFSLVSSLLIFSYATLIAVETNMMSLNPDKQLDAIKTLHYMFTCLFSLELSLRFVADGCKAFCGEEGRWNRLDAFFIMSGITEIVMESTAHSDEGAGSAGSIVRGVRIFRVFRTVRLVRTFRHFYEFQKMAYALISSFKTLLCSLALLIFVMYFFAVWFTQSAADSAARETIPDLKLRYGDIMSTMYTLFLSVSNGISWDGCFIPLWQLSFFSSQGFILYIVIVLFGVLNVVTSVFVESVIRSVQHYKDIIVKDKEEEKKIAASHVQEVFNTIDRDGTGEVSIDEMEHFLQDPALRKYMEALDIDIADTRLLFRLLDSDESGWINVEEFVDGCLSFKGEAKSIDIHALTFSLNNFLEKWGEFTGYVEENFIDIKKTIKEMQGGKPNKSKSLPA